MLLQRSFKFLLPLALVCAGVPASPSPSPGLSPFVLHERRSHIPFGWSLARRHDSSATIPLRFGLKQSNTHKIDEYLYDVSHPSSANYGKHWTHAEVAATFAPSDETVDTVRNWLIGSGIASEKIRLTASKGWLEVEVTIEEAERLINADFQVYRHETGQEHVACDEYHLPLQVAPHVEIVLPSVHFDAKIIQKRSASTLNPSRSVGGPGTGNGPKLGAQTTPPSTNSDITDCDEEITIDCLKALYNISYTPVSGDSNTYGIVEYTPEAYLQSDLDKFFQVYAPDLVGVSPIEINIDGGLQQTDEESFDFNGEPSLDLQYGMALVTSAQNVTLYQVGDLVEGASFNNLLDAFDASFCTFEGGDDSSEDGIYPDNAPGGFTGSEACGTLKPAFVISTSYSYDEADLTPFYTSRQCTEYAKLGLMGVTMLYSSGDFGVAGHDGVCLNPDGSQTADVMCYWSIWYQDITSVGATQINPGSTVEDPESACEQVIFSGGGFSNYFSIPSYQQSVVTSFLDNFSSDNFTTAKFNASGTSRAYPDIAANGANYNVAVDGEFELVYGTSCSSPVVGAMITLVNDARIAAGKAPVGFLNPTIYDPSFASAFNDITSGGNQGCGTVGFTATTGWDPVTGLGTPNLGLLMEAYLGLP